jgi:putative membrane protein
VPFHPSGLVTEWSLAPFPIATLFVLIGLAIWYMDAVQRMRARGKSWSNARVLAFLAGLLAIEYALGGPVSVYVMTMFPAHIAQHLLLMIVAPGLLSLSAPVTLALQTLAPRRRALLQSFLHSTFLKVVTFPLVVFLLYYGVMWWFFTTSALGYAMEHMWLMDMVNILFFLGGVLFWWPLIGKDTILHWRTGFGGKIATLGIGIPFETFLGLTISANRTPLAPMYSAASWYTGGQVLWGASEVLTTIGLAIVIGQWIASEDRMTKRMAQSRSQTPLSSRGDGMPKEYYWAQQTIARTPPGTPMHEEAERILAQIAREQQAR